MHCVLTTCRTLSHHPALPITASCHTSPPNQTHTHTHRFFADCWMLFPTEAEYIEWFTKAGFKDVKMTRIGPKWYRGVRRHGLIMGCSVTGVKPEVRTAGNYALPHLCWAPLSTWCRLMWLARRRSRPPAVGHHTYCDWLLWVGRGSALVHACACVGGAGGTPLPRLGWESPLLGRRANLTEN